jgi:large subunit ribosomal protein L11
MKTPPASYFIKQAAGITAGSQKPGHQSVATISLKHLHGIAEVKQKDTPNVPLESVVKGLIGTCRAMGVKVVAQP